MLKINIIVKPLIFNHYDKFNLIISEFSLFNQILIMNKTNSTNIMIKNSSKIYFEKKPYGRIFFLFYFFFVVSIVVAQTTNISGRVSDKNGDAIIGASIRILSTNTGTITDVDGNFSIPASIGDKIEIAYVGYLSQSIKINKKEFLNITLEEDVVTLGDVVVVGYGTQKKESLTGSISNLKVDEITKTKSASLAQAIQGKVAGLQIRQENGEPGQFSSNINIRGLGTPLFIIDGIVRDGSSEFQRLNPEDIESISFLKDATAAIYGMNSANGAIIVTTKKGKQGKTRITLNTNVGISSPTDIPQMANAGQYMTMRNEAEVNAGRPPYITQEELLKWQQGAPGYKSYDYYDEVFDKYATQYQTTLSLEGGTEKLSYYGSIGYADDNSFLKTNSINYNKYTFRSNVSLKVAKGLTASVNIGGRYDTGVKPYTPFFDIFKSTRVNPPTEPIYANDNPNYYNNFASVINPMALSDNETTGDITNTNRNIQSQFILEYDVPFVKGLTVKGTLGYDYNSQREKTIRKSFKTYIYNEMTGEYNGTETNAPSLVRDYRRESDRLDLQFQANYNRSFGRHSIGATYVFERRELKASHSQGERKFDFFTIGELDNARETGQLASGTSDHQAYLSHIGRITYNYAEKYLAEFACRYDGSYRYAPGKRWAFFPSASFGWRISEEDFIKDNLDFIDNLKLRFSLGRSGQDAGDPFQYIEAYTLNNGGSVFTPNNYVNGVASPAMINPNLTWVKVDMYNLGLDFSIFNHLLDIEFDIYQRERKGLLADRYGSLPNTFGSKLPQENLNGDRTRGIEFTLTHSNQIGEFYYSISGNLNLSRTQNRYIESAPFKSSMERWKHQQANRWGDFIWGYQVEGRFENMDQVNTFPIQNGDTGNLKELPGDFVLKDVNGDGVINDMDKVPLFWSGTPLLHYGLNLQASWKNFDFYMLFQGSAMYTVQFDEVYAKMLCFKGGNTPEYFYDRWHREDPYDENSAWIPGEWPAIRLEQDMGSLYTRDTDVWRKNASYLRLKTIEIGYTFKQKFLKDMGLGDLRVYVNGNNLFTICNSFVKPFDPEKIEGNYSAGLNYPLSKIINVGFTLNF